MTGTFTVAIAHPGDTVRGMGLNPVTGEVFVVIDRADGTQTEETIRPFGGGPIKPGDEAFVNYFPLYGGVRPAG